MKIAKWLGFGRGSAQKKRRAAAMRKRPLLGERLENRSLLTVVVDDVDLSATSCVGGHPDYNSIQAAANAAGQNVIQICDGTYDNEPENLVDANGVLLSFGSPTGVVTIDGGLTLGSSLMEFNINGDTPGTDYSQLVVNGRVFEGNIDGVNINNNVSLSVNGTRQANDGQAIVLIANHSAQNTTEFPVGPFNGLPEGSLVDVAGVKYVITYKYNAENAANHFSPAGNDVALIDVSGSLAPTTGTARLVTDPSNLSQKALVVSGTSANNTIEVRPKDTTNVEVKINGVSQGVWPASDITGNIIIYGGAGDDKITIDPHVMIPVVALGEGGKDTLQAGGGPAVLVGGDGDDTLNGNNSSDILIGGMGKDNLHGNGGDDTLIGGYTAFDTDLVALERLLSDPSLLVADNTVFDDSITDTMDGNGGSDYYFANSDVAFKDNIKLTKDDEGVIDIDPAPSA
ncbi:MAG TPA: calcium-binding protein [Pirellulaceae bacterium]